VNAVLRVDLEPGRTARLILDDLVDPSGAIALGRLIELRKVARDRHLWVGKDQMNGLILFMIGIGNEHRRQLVETNLTIGFRVHDLGALTGGL